jgi:AcrR family transcriptional regulator
MPRKKGSKNADFDASRAAILVRLCDSLLGDDPPSSYRGLAVAAGATIPTLHHYFGNREAVFSAVFADLHVGGQKELAVTEEPSGKFRKSVSDLVSHISDGFRYGLLDRLHAIGLIEGLSHQLLAKSYLAEVLEPTIMATTRRLDAHLVKGEMRDVNTRYAAISLLSPIILIFLHQNGLCGESDYPIDIDDFLKNHADAFTSAYENPPNLK